MSKIAVEESLSDISSALQQKGYEVITLKNEQDVQGCDCCVISGQDKNVMGMADVSTQQAVINADGSTAEQVCQQVEQRLR
ncbi:YkuS family protein [Thalassobacillus devorans]|uniref:YkuS family protein n=1 Tax=Thalassobacillus devorans TaxID=279813 RepID=UPI00048B57EC|nr:YkuS family protein [Thalassobacillus devorans]